MLKISKQLPDRRWAIYIDGMIAAYISCPKTYKKITQLLENRLRQTNRVNAVEQKV